VDKSDITKLLVDDYNEAGKRLTQFMVLDERLLATGVSVISAAASVAIGSGKTYFLLVVPVALAFLFLVIDFLHAEVLALGGYRSVLEEAIETRIGTPISGWERHVAPLRHAARTTAMTRVVAATIYLASVCAALVEASNTTNAKHWGSDHSTLVLTASTLSIAVSGAAVLVSKARLRSEYRRVREATSASLLTKWVAEPEARSATG
jgi:hypothetical protein